MLLGSKNFDFVGLADDPGTFNTRSESRKKCLSQGPGTTPAPTWKPHYSLFCSLFDSIIQFKPCIFMPAGAGAHTKPDPAQVASLGWYRVAV